MKVVVADTHAAIWYFGGESELSAPAREFMDAVVAARDSIVLASITLVEVAYLAEKGRVPPNTFDRLTDALGDPAYRLVLAPLDLNVAEALRRIPRAEIPDMPDRIIAATALYLGLPVVSRDRKIRASAIRTIWSSRRGLIGRQEGVSHARPEIRRRSPRCNQGELPRPERLDGRARTGRLDHRGR